MDKNGIILKIIKISMILSISIIFHLLAKTEKETRIIDYIGREIIKIIKMILKTYI